METVGATEAAYLNALFWGTFSLGRLFSIAIATYASPQLMLVANIVSRFFATVGTNDSIVPFWDSLDSGFESHLCGDGCKKILQRLFLACTIFTVFAPKDLT